MSRVTKLLRELTASPLTVEEISSRIGLSKVQVYRIIKKLEKLDIVKLSRGTVSFQKSEEALIIAKLVDKFVVDPLLDKKSIMLLLLLEKPRSVAEILKIIDISEPALYKLLHKLSELGYIRRVDGRYVLIEDSDVRTAVSIFHNKAIAEIVKGIGIPVYIGPGFVLKKVPKGVKAEGSLTAFSLFPKYGVKISLPWDYYVYPPTEESREHVLVHALLAAQSKYERTLVAVFYAKNRDKIDSTKVRRIAKGTPALKMLVELGSYILGLPSGIHEYMLPWDEFKKLSKLYNIDLVEPPYMSEIEKYFLEVGKQLVKEVSAYVFGGLNLLFLGVKISTKDIDLIVEDKYSYNILLKALLAAGYKPLIKSKWSVDDKKAGSVTIFVKNSLRVDLFVGKISGEVSLTPGMKERAKKGITYSKLMLKFLSIEDVILLKSITGRERDIEDIAILARKIGVDWNAVLKSLEEQGRKISEKYAFAVLEAIEILEEAYAIKIPRRVKKKLEKLALKYSVKKALEMGYKKPSEIRKLVKFPESKIRRILKEISKEENEPKV